MLRTVGSVRSAELEQALLLLPFTDALRLLGYLVTWLKKGTQVRPPGVVMVGMHGVVLWDGTWGAGEAGRGSC